ncbi:hypothetical protein [Sphingomonas abietis]|uniref:Uncharacterized protein n=1 Tax=Sphingomonas abietis TaxID=3012344 RepID=A0ABY7NNX5_9SPHN|nr:hypothetical protein [Sphingomonas abietis]WBO23239.1 hypothetical protein PBT88_03620 [Sphingomonas abietis]
MTDADLANTATDFYLTGYSMGQLRTANKRHKRAVAARLTASKAPANDAKAAAPAQKADA